MYFKEFKKFPRNLFKSSANSLHISQNETYLITTGSEADTIVNVFSMNGDRLATANTYQIEHYDVDFSRNHLIVRGWTSEVKIYEMEE